MQAHDTITEDDIRHRLGKGYYEPDPALFQLHLPPLADPKALTGHEYAQRKADQTELRRTWRQEANRLRQAFDRDVLTCLGLASHSKGARLMELAHERSSSWNDVLLYADELAELLR